MHGLIVLLGMVTFVAVLVLLAIRREALAEAGYTVHNEYSSKSIDIIWGYVDVMKKKEM